MAKERKFDGVWEAERHLRNNLYYTNEEGYLIDMNSYEESPYKIRQRRFLAAMKDYGSYARWNWTGKSEIFFSLYS